jgi:quinol monooxygenase YgiN
MIKVIAKITIKPDMTDDLKNIVPGLVAETRKENGCLSYQLFQDIKVKNVFAMIEEWENQEALDKHMNSKHFQEAIPKIVAIQEKDIEINVYTLVI